jgi:S-adenosylmethionine:tRNA ribosyltransferase-isomerase
MFSISDYDYHLPEKLIAQIPASQRDQSRLLCLDRKTGAVTHHLFSDIVDFLQPSDLMVVNNTRVIPGRLNGRKESGGKVEVLIIDYARQNQRKDSDGKLIYECLIKASKAPKPGSRLLFGLDLEAIVTEVLDRTFCVKFICQTPFDEILDRIGEVPLPPYIHRDQANGRAQTDRDSYQTVYAVNKGAVAAPTAGLHFSDNLLAHIRQKDIEIIEITLHVGYGTFMPVRVEDIREHQIHSEYYTISAEAAEIITRAKKQLRRVIAVGTTTVRTLEFAARENGTLTPGSGSCDLFIYPGYEFKMVDAMITNFHLPKSTLLMLVSAFAGRKNVLNAYNEAIKENYRFFSYGDAMFIE